MKILNEFDGFVKAFQHLASVQTKEDFVYPETDVVRVYVQECLAEMAKSIASMSKVTITFVDISISSVIEKVMDVSIRSS